MKNNRSLRLFSLRTMRKNINEDEKKSLKSFWRKMDKIRRENKRKNFRVDSLQLAQELQELKH